MAHDCIPVLVLNKIARKGACSMITKLFKNVVLLWHKPRNSLGSTKLNKIFLGNGENYKIERKIVENWCLHEQSIFSGCTLQNSLAKSPTTRCIIVNLECILEYLKSSFFLSPRLSYPIVTVYVCSSFPKAHCQTRNEKVTCEGSLFWKKGFVAFQAAINAAIIEVSIKLKKQVAFVS